VEGEDNAVNGMNDSEKTAEANDVITEGGKAAAVS
jgi:hypothetical protein